jgi:hypothetical protein
VCVKLHYCASMVKLLIRLYLALKHFKCRHYICLYRVIYNFITDPTIGPFSRVRRRIQDEYNEKKQNGENMTMNGKQSGKAHIE